MHHPVNIFRCVEALDFGPVRYPRVCRSALLFQPQSAELCEEGVMPQWTKGMIGAKVIVAEPIPCIDTDRFHGSFY
jgi:hypothetical protein